MPVLEITLKKTLNVGSSILAEEGKMNRSGRIQTPSDRTLKQFKPKFLDRMNFLLNSAQTLITGLSS